MFVAHFYTVGYRNYDRITRCAYLWNSECAHRLLSTVQGNGKTNLRAENSRNFLFDFCEKLQTEGQKHFFNKPWNIKSYLCQVPGRFGKAAHIKYLILLSRCIKSTCLYLSLHKLYHGYKKRMKETKQQFSVGYKIPRVFSKTWGCTLFIQSTGRQGNM